MSPKTRVSFPKIIASLYDSPAAQKTKLYTCFGSAFSIPRNFGCILRTKVAISRGSQSWTMHLEPKLFYVHHLF